MKYQVNTLRAVGLQARWTRTRSGAPIIAARDGDAAQWYVVDDAMWKRMGVVGVLEGWRNCTALGAFFSVSA